MSDSAELSQAKIDYYKTLTEKAGMEVGFARDVRAEFEASSDQARLYAFNRPVLEETVNACITSLGQWHRETPDRTITVIFNSPGGLIHPGFALLDYIAHIQNEGTTVNTHSIGWAASMCAILLQAGQTRSMGKHAYMMIHEIDSENIGNTSEVEDSLKFVQRLQNDCLDVLAERCNKSKRYIKDRWERRNWWLSAQEALDLGFIDQIK